MKRKVVLAFLLTGALVLSGCSKTNNSNETSSGSTSTDSSAQGIDVSNMFSDRDKEIGYDEENSTVIKLSDDSTTCDSDAVQISGNTVTIIDEGTYILSGTLTDGMVIVDAEDTDKVQLCAQLRVCNQVGGNPIYPRSSQPDNSESWDVVGNSN